MEAQIGILRDQKARSETPHEIAKKQIESLEKAEKDFSASSILGQMKLIVWGNIIETVDGMWHSIHIIF